MAFARLIVNGKSADEPALRAAVDTLRAEHHSIEVRVTWEKGDASRFAREAAADGAERVIAAGGDGTLQEVVDALVGTVEPAKRPSLGVIALGTANDFATAASIPVEMENALRLALESTAQAVDALRVGDRYGINVATGGFGTEITTGTSDDLKKSIGSIAYLLTGIARMRDFRPVAATIRGPDFEWRGSFLMMAAGNARFAGGGHPVCPEALVDDGLLDLTILPDEGEGVAAALREWIAGGVDAVLEHCVTARLPWCTIDAPDGLHLNLDGEPLEGVQFRIESVPDALRVHLPAACGLRSR